MFPSELDSAKELFNRIVGSIDDHDERLRKLEVEQAKQGVRIGMYVGFVCVAATFIINFLFRWFLK